PKRGLAADVLGHRSILCRQHARASSDASESPAEPGANLGKRARADLVTTVARAIRGRPADSSDHCGICVLCGHVNATGASGGLLRRSGLRGGAWCANALADAWLWHRQSTHIRLDLRPYRRTAHVASWIQPPGDRAAPVPSVRWARLAVPYLGVVRPVSGWHRTRLRHHHSSVLF